MPRSPAQPQGRASSAELQAGAAKAPSSPGGTRLRPRAAQTPGAEEFIPVPGGHQPRARQRRSLWQRRRPCCPRPLSGTGRGHRRVGAVPSIRSGPRVSAGPRGREGLRPAQFQEESRRVQAGQEEGPGPGKPKSEPPLENNRSAAQLGAGTRGCRRGGGGCAHPFPSLGSSGPVSLSPWGQSWHPPEHAASAGPGAGELGRAPRGSQKSRSLSRASRSGPSTRLHPSILLSGGATGARAAGGCPRCPGGTRGKPCSGRPLSVRPSVRESPEEARCSQPGGDRRRGHCVLKGGCGPSTRGEEGSRAPRGLR